MTSEEKDKIINDIYYDQSGYGSVKRTYSEARIISSKITLKYVQEWFNTNVGKKSQPVGTNSFIAPHAHYEYQGDIFLLEIWGSRSSPTGWCASIFSVSLQW